MPVCIAIFQFTPLREGRPDDRNVPAERLNISIHAPPRGATFSATGFPSVVRFQFTPLREGRQTAPQPHSGRQTDFNSRPSARGDTDKQRRASAATISIHAPPRGATRRKGGDATRHAISIHAPPRGATKQRRARAATTTHFNSRPSARGDISEQKERMVHHISIHAPPRGATNPPPPRAAVPLFQFTPLREGRPCRFACCFLAFCISIHAPPRGATEPAAATRGGTPISIHAPPRGATFCPWASQSP